MISSARLTLRPYGIGDFEPYAAMVAEGPTPLTREDAWNRLLRYIGHWEAFGYGLFAAFDARTGELIGEAGLARFGRDLGATFDSVPEASWTIAAGFRGRGLASEAAERAHAWFDERFRPVRTVCLIDPCNTSSMRVAAKLGYEPFAKTRYRDAAGVMLERRPPGAGGAAPIEPEEGAT